MICTQHDEKFRIMFAKNGCLACQCEHEAALKQCILKILKEILSHERTREVMPSQLKFEADEIVKTYFGKDYDLP